MDRLTDRRSFWATTACAIACGGRLRCGSTRATASEAGGSPPPSRSQAHLCGTSGVHENQSDDALGRCPGTIGEARWVASDPGSRCFREAVIRFEDRPSRYLRATVSFSDVHLLFEWPEDRCRTSRRLAGYDSRLLQQDLESLGFVPARETSSVRTPPAPTLPTPSARPILTRAVSRAYPINTDQDMGVTEFRRANPSFDGRGVGIGVLESTWIPVDHPAFASARALDGMPRRKILRYLEYPGVRRESGSAPMSEWFDCKSAVCEAQRRVLKLPAAGRADRGSDALWQRSRRSPEWLNTRRSRASRGHL